MRAFAGTYCNLFCPVCLFSLGDLLLFSEIKQCWGGDLGQRKGGVGELRTVDGEKTWSG